MLNLLKWTLSDFSMRRPYLNSTVPLIESITVYLCVQDELPTTTIYFYRFLGASEFKKKHELLSKQQNK